MHTDQFNHAPAELAALHRLGAVRPAVDGFLGDLRPGLGKPEPARLHRPGLQRHLSQRRQQRLEQRLSAVGLPGRAVPLAGRPGALRLQPAAAWIADLRRLSLDALRDLNEMQASELGSPETRTRIAQYELAFRMQTAVPEVMDISREPRQVLDMYGAQPGAVELRQQLPAGPPAGRAGRALRAAARLGLGFPRHQPGRGHPRGPGATSAGPWTGRWPP